MALWFTRPVASARSTSDASHASLIFLGQLFETSFHMLRSVYSSMLFRETLIETQRSPDVTQDGLATQQKDYKGKYLSTIRRTRSKAGTFRTYKLPPCTVV